MTRRSFRLAPGDLVRTAWVGVSGRPQRTVLASLGIALGIAALVSLTGISASGRAQLLADLDAMGADLAIVAPAPGPDGEPVPLPASAPAALLRQDGVDRVGVFETAPADLAVYRTDMIPDTQAGGLSVAVARPDVFSAIGGRIESGRWFDAASRALPVTVLGSVAADRLGIDQAGDRVLIGGEWYGVLGILEPSGLASDIDTTAILGDEWVREHFDEPGIGGIRAVYVRAAPGRIDEVMGSLAPAASPGSPFVAVSALTDLAGARTAADDSLAELGIALAAIALLVGGLGIANTMVVAVMERRGEIGLRRALGARRGQIVSQFVTEAAVLSALGGVAGVLLGTGGAASAAMVTGQPVVIPVEVLVVGPAAAVAVGAVAGVAPALRAARLSPSAALRAS